MRTLIVTLVCLSAGSVFAEAPLVPPDAAAWKKIETVARERALANHALKQPRVERIIGPPGNQDVKKPVRLDAGRCYLFMFAWGFDAGAQITAQIKADKQGRVASFQTWQDLHYDGRNGGVIVCADRAGEAVIGANASRATSRTDQYGWALASGSWVETPEEAAKRRPVEQAAEAKIHRDAAARKAYDRASLKAMVRSDCRVCFRRFEVCGGSARCEAGLKRCVGEVGLNNGITEKEADEMCILRIGGR